MALKDHLDRAVARWNAGDLDGYLGLYDETLRLHGYAPEPMGKAEATGFYQMICATLSPPGRATPVLDIHDAMESGDRLACRFTMSGAHSGPFMNIPASGKPYMLAGITMLRFANGRVVERWASADMLGLLVQIGAVPPPG